MIKMLIVGGAGYIGGYMTDMFSANPEYQITVYDNLLYESRFLKDVEFIFGDIRDTHKLGKLIKNYDIVVWLAAIVGDGACAVNPQLTDEVNTDTVRWVVENYDGKLVFMSTCSVYGMNKELIDESAAPNPLSIYASSKLAAERYIVENSNDYLIFRLGTLYGLGDAFSRIRLDLVVNVLTLNAFINKKISVFGGEQWRPILHVKDVSYATKYCLEHNIQGLYNLSEQNVEISALAWEIKKLIPDTEILFQDIKFEDKRDYKVINKRIMDTGWCPKFTLEQGVREIHKIISEQRIKDPLDPVYYNIMHLNKMFKGDSN